LESLILKHKKINVFIESASRGIFDHID